MRIVQKEHILVAGYVGRDAEIKETGTGKRLVSFSISASKGEDGKTNWANCTAWESNAALFNMARTIKKGSYALVCGTHKMSERGYIDVTCEYIELSDSGTQAVSKGAVGATPGFEEVEDEGLPF